MRASENRFDSIIEVESLLGKIIFFSIGDRLGADRSGNFDIPSTIDRTKPVALPCSKIHQI